MVPRILKMIDALLRAFWPAFLAAGLIQFLFVLRRGTFRGSDTTRYESFADQLLSSGWNYLEWLAPNFGPRLLHSGFVTLIAILKLVGGANWEMLLVLLNVLAYAATVALIGTAARELTGSTVASAIAAGLYAGCFEVFSWPAGVLSDSTFALAAFAVWLWFTRTAVCTRVGLPGAAAICAAIGALLLYRPSALAMVFSAFVFAAMRFSRRAAAAALAVAVTALVMVTSVLLANPSLWPFTTLRPAVERFAAEAARGEVVIDRPETFIPGVESTVDVAHVILVRFVRFFQFTSDAFSTGHNLLNVLVFVPMYLGFGVALWLMFRGRLNTAEAAATTTALVWTIAFATLHALTQLDYDWRYRLPIIGPVVCVAALGIREVLALVRVPDSRAVSNAETA